VSSNHGVVPMGAGRAPVLCHWEMNRSKIPSLLEAMLNNLLKSSIMGPSGGDPVQVVPTKMAHESLPLGERLRLPKQSTNNSRPPKRMVLLREKPLHIRCAPSVAMASIDE
jgi:hypothetical protein